MVSVKKDLTGQLFGKLKVVKQVEDYVNPSTGKHCAQWLCECLCKDHNQVIVTTGRLTSGNTQSCGCLHKELLIKYNKEVKKKHNQIDLSGDYGVGWTTNTNREFYFDLDDYDKIKDYAWREKMMNNGQYHALVARDPLTKLDIIMAWLIIGKNYDHKDRNPLNNRKENLRKATYVQNAQNRTISTKNNSGFIGIHWNKQNKKWTAQISIDGEKVFLGSFLNKEDAIKARLQAELKYFGEFAPQHHLFEEYNIKLDVKENSNMDVFDEELHEDNPELSQPIARCAECGELIYDNSSEMYTDEDNNYFCCLSCALNYYGIRQSEDSLCWRGLR